MAKGNRGGKRAGGAVINDDTHINGKNIFTDNLTWDEYDTVYNREMSKILAEMAEEERQLDDVQKQVDAWISDKNSTQQLDEVVRPDGNSETLYLEKDTKKNIIDNYLKEYNDGYWDDNEGSINVLYKDGSFISSLDAPNKFKLTNIDTIIVNGGWGTTFSGNVKVTHDVPDEKFDVVRGGGAKINVGNSVRHLPEYKGFQAVWHVDFK